MVILAGGAGNRLGGDTPPGPKPMVDIGGKPLLWHIMSQYSAYGFDEFVVAVGYLGGQIKRYFAEFDLVENDVRIQVPSGRIEVHGAPRTMKWSVDVVDTGRWTESGGRLKRLEPLLQAGTFMMTFGDAVSDVDLGALVEFHRSQGKVATLTAVHPPPRFGELRLEGDMVTDFSEKPMDAGWINGGFMAFEPRIFEYIDGDHVGLSLEPMQRLAQDGELAAYRHQGFWQSVDSMRDKVMLEELWASPEPPWRTWVEG
ncbi:MAG TPA: glucose-1-phosphate cytidylyltransferase [Acidimicrobiia bacterium]|nr:glucose-1-phosphate cytidylyltransferase [Acidimicrobiia bacterium]